MEINIGTIILSTGEISIIDPIYDVGIGLGIDLDNVHKGEWVASVEVIDCGDKWGHRIDFLRIQAINETSVIFKGLKGISVDSGVCGIFEDKPYYTTNDNYGTVYRETKNKFDLWYGLAKKDNAFKCIGVYSESGYGDGNYTATIGYNENNEIVSILVDYDVDEISHIED